MKARTIVIASVVTLASVGGIGYGIYHTMTSNKDPVQVVPVSNVNYSYWGDEISSYGTITANVSQNISLSNDYQIAEVYVEEGQEVKIGDPLFAYDMTLAELDLEMEKLNGQTLALSKESLERELKKLENTTATARVDAGNSLGSIMTASGEEGGAAAEAADGAQPAAETSAPAAEASAPAPVAEAPAPTTEAPAPATEAPAPATEAPAPATEAPAPATEAPAPATEAPAPATEAPASATEAPASATEAPVPATEAPATEASAPATEAPATEAPTTEAPATEAPATEKETEAPATEGAASPELTAEQQRMVAAGEQFISKLLEWKKEMNAVQKWAVISEAWSIYYGGNVLVSPVAGKQAAEGWNGRSYSDAYALKAGVAEAMAAVGKKELFERGYENLLKLSYRMELADVDEDTEKKDLEALLSLMDELKRVLEENVNTSTPTGDEQQYFTDIADKRQRIEARIAALESAGDAGNEGSTESAGDAGNEGGTESTGNAGNEGSTESTGDAGNEGNTEGTENAGDGGTTEGAESGSADTDAGTGSEPGTAGTETEAETDDGSVKNIVAYEVEEGARVMCDGEDVTNDTGLARDGKIVFSVEPEAGYEVAEVMVDGTTPARGTGNDGEYIIEGIQTDNTVVSVGTARAAGAYLVNFIADTGVTVMCGGQEVTGAAAMAEDGKIIFTAVPQEGYRVAAIEVEGGLEAKKTGNEHEYAIEGIETENLVVKVKTEKEAGAYSVIFSADEGVVITCGGKDVTNGEGLALNGKIVFTAVPEDGYQIAGVKAEDGLEAKETGNENEYVIEGIETDNLEVAVMTRREEGVWFVTFKADEGVTVTCGDKDVTGAAAVARDGKLVFTAVPQEGYLLAGI